jgi:hypothetical protein
MTDYQGNSHKQKEEEVKKQEKHIERITSGEVIIQKKGPWRKFKSLIIEADMNSVGRFIWFELLIPSFKNLLVDTVEQGIKRTVYGDRRAAYRPPSSSLGVGQTSRISYNSPVVRYHPDPAASQQRALPSAPRSTVNDPRGYIIPSRDEAERVLEMMANVIDTYDVITVADLHGMLGLESTYVDQKWGWINMVGAQIRQVREGWVLELPPAEEMQN